MYMDGAILLLLNSSPTLYFVAFEVNGIKEEITDLIQQLTHLSKESEATESRLI